MKVRSQATEIRVGIKIRGNVKFYDVVKDMLLRWDMGRAKTMVKQHIGRGHGHGRRKIRVECRSHR